MIYANGILVERKTFPNGETLIDGEKLINRLGKDGKGEFYPCKITLIFENDLDLMSLYWISEFLKEIHCPAMLAMTYLPYSRMDRKPEQKDVFTLKYLSKMINNMGFTKVIVQEPHSEVSLALLNNVQVRYFFEKTLGKLSLEGIFKDGDYLMYPDASAEKRYSERLKKKYILGVKHRDWNTGKIDKYMMFNATNEPYDTTKSVFIIDDICSKGTTAYNAALALKEEGFENIFLVVAHCEQTIFDGKLLDEDSPVKTIYTSDSMVRNKHDKIWVIQ